jgi:cyclic peptide transporter
MIRSFLRIYSMTLLAAACLSAVSAGVVMVLLGHINRIAAHGLGAVDFRPVIIGVGWLAALLVIDLMSQWVLARLGGELVARLRTELSRRFVDLEYEKLANRKHLIFAVLVEDISRLAPFAQMAPQIAYSAILALLCSVYLLTICAPLFGVLFVFLAVTTFVYVRVLGSARVQFDQMRRVEATLLEQYRAIGEGKKEMTLNPQRVRHLLDTLLAPAIAAAREPMVRFHLRLGCSSSWSSVGLYGAIFAVVCLGNSVLHLQPGQLLSFVVGVFFFVGPFNVLIGSGRPIEMGLGSLRHIERVGLDVRAEVDSAPSPREAALPAAAPWRRIRAEGLCYRYPGEADVGFGIGPIDLDIRRGEMVFFVGGNGSGKSTLLLLLCGLLSPSAGRLLLDGRAVTDELSSYRGLFAGVFGDFHLFAHVLGADGQCLSDREVEALLQRLQLESKVQVRQGKLSTLALSTGQRKRLALLQAYADDRDVYFFDEWAADQDPQSRAHFYDVLLPDLKRRGKTVVVITHDDRYFDVADRIVKLESGLVVSDGSQAEQTRLVSERSCKSPESNFLTKESRNV